MPLGRCNQIFARNGRLASHSHSRSPELFNLLHPARQHNASTVQYSHKHRHHSIVRCVGAAELPFPCSQRKWARRRQAGRWAAFAARRPILLTASLYQRVQLVDPRPAVSCASTLGRSSSRCRLVSGAPHHCVAGQYDCQEAPGVPIWVWATRRRFSARKPAASLPTSRLDRARSLASALENFARQVIHGPASRQTSDVVDASSESHGDALLALHARAARARRRPRAQVLSPPLQARAILAPAAQGGRRLCLHQRQHQQRQGLRVGGFGRHCRSTSSASRTTGRGQAHALERAPVVEEEQAEGAGGCAAGRPEEEEEAEGQSRRQHARPHHARGTGPAHGSWLTCVPRLQLVLSGD